MTALLVALGGALGTLGRYWIRLALLGTPGAAGVVGTFLVNVLGSFLLGVVVETCAGRTIAGVDTRLVLGVGVLGGFTTYSSFNMEAIQIAQQGEWGRAGGYMLATAAVCIAAGLAGLALGRAIRTAG
jgi:CrcB protein